MGENGFPEYLAVSVHGIFVAGIVAQGESQQVEKDGGGVGMPTSLNLEMAESHVAQLLDFRCVQSQHALVFICQQGVKAAAAIGYLSGFELAEVVAHEIER